MTAAANTLHSNDIQREAVTDRTRTGTIIDAHHCHWTLADGDHGQCRCGLIVTTEDEWRRHTEHFIIEQLWHPNAELITSETVLQQLPPDSTIAAHPGRDNVVLIRIDAADAWCNLNGTFWSNRKLLPALLLERGPDPSATPNNRTQS